MNCFVKNIMRTLFLALLCASFSLSIVSVFAQEAEAENKKESTQQEQAPQDAEAEAELYTYDQPVVEEVSYTWIIVKTMVVLALLALGFFFFFRYVTGKATGPIIGRNVLQVKAVLPIGQNRMLQIVEVGSKLLVLGVTDSQITLLKEITEKDEVDRIKLESSTSDIENVGDFQSFLTKSLSSFISNLGRKGENSDNSPQGSSDEHFDHSQVLDPGEDHTARRTFFEDDRLDYIRQQKNRLKKLGGFDED